MIVALVAPLICLVAVCAWAVREAWRLRTDAARRRLIAVCKDDTSGDVPWQSGIPQPWAVDHRGHKWTEEDQRAYEMACAGGLDSDPPAVV